MCSLEGENLRELFQLNKKTECETHDLLKCSRPECSGSPNGSNGVDKAVREAGQICLPCLYQRLEKRVLSDLLTWTHHSRGRNIEEPVTAHALKSDETLVSFVMQCRMEFTD